MRHTATALVVLGLAAFLATTAFASPFWCEGFTYNNGNLTTVSSLWTTHSGSGADLTVVSGVLYGSMVTGTNDDNRLIPARGATDKTYSCFKVLIPTISGSPTGSVYFAHFRLGTNFKSKVFVTSSGSTFTFALAVGGNTITPPTGGVWPVALNYDQWYTVATLYDAATGTSKLWIDPFDEASPCITAVDAVGIGVLIDSYAFRQTSSNWQYHVDDLAVGPTFGDVCPIATPALSTSWGRLKSLYH